MMLKSINASRSCQLRFFPTLLGWVLVLNRALLPPPPPPPASLLLSPTCLLPPTCILLLACCYPAPSRLLSISTRPTRNLCETHAQGTFLGAWQQCRTIRSSTRPPPGNAWKPMRNLCAGHTPRGLAAASNQQYLNKSSPRERVETHAKLMRRAHSLRPGNRPNRTSTRPSSVVGCRRHRSRGSRRSRILSSHSP